MDTHAGPGTAGLGPLVDAAWVAANIDDPRLRVIDFRWELQSGSRRDQYLEGHIPGAVFVRFETVTGSDGPGRHPLPSSASFGAAMRQAGVNHGSMVVVYDETGGFSAARLRWLLRHFGHDLVAVLDGGLPAWPGALETGDRAIAAGDFEPAPPRDDVVDRARVGQPGEGDVLVDARVPERYRGDLEPIDPRAGHVPGAVNLPWSDNLEADRRFRSPAALRRRYEELGVTPGQRPIVYCGSGVSACVDLLALEVAGLGPGVLYEGSWGDWSSQRELPLETGDDPRREEKPE